MKPKLPKGNYSEGFLKFFDWAIDYYREAGKIIDIRNSSYVFYQGKCGGYCDGNKVVVAGKSKNFQKTFAHELMHLDQSIEDSPLWTSEDWWSGSFDITHFSKILNIVALERDCEDRVLKLNRKWNLFKESEYIKEANAYLLSYNFMFLNRNWNMQNSIYKKEILEIMPDTLIPLSQLRVIDMNLMIKFNTFLRR